MVETENRTEKRLASCKPRGAPVHLCAAAADASPVPAQRPCVKLLNPPLPPFRSLPSWESRLERAFKRIAFSFSRPQPRPMPFRVKMTHIPRDFGTAFFEACTSVLFYLCGAARLLAIQTGCFFEEKHACRNWFLFAHISGQTRNPALMYVLAHRFRGNFTSCSHVTRSPSGSYSGDDSIIILLTRVNYRDEF